MKKLIGLCVAVLCGCGNGTVPELYEVTLDYFSPPASCYRTAMLPSTLVTQGDITALTFRVWDGPDNKAYLEVLKGVTGNIDMGDAPSITMPSTLAGVNTATGWKFSGDRSAQNTNGLNMDVTTNAQSVAFTFARSGTVKGTLDLSSSTTCTGTTGCPTMLPSCSITGVAFQGTKLASDYSVIDYGQNP